MNTEELEQGSDEWHKARLGKPTASAASKLITSTGARSKQLEAYAYKLAGERYSGRSLDEWEGNKYTDRGTELEPEARAAYEIKYNVDVIEKGFMTDKSDSYGMSPDGLIGEDGLLEIKCLPVGHIPAILYYNKHKKPPSDRIAQVQFQLLVSGRKWCDLWFYQPGLPSLRIRVDSHKAYQSDLELYISEAIRIRDETILVLNEFK